MSDQTHLTSNEYLGLDRDELRGVVRERDAEIERLRAALRHAVNTEGGIKPDDYEYIRKVVSGDSSAPETSPEYIGPVKWLRSLGWEYCAERDSIVKLPEETTCTRCGHAHREGDQYCIWDPTPSQNGKGDPS